MAWVQGDCAVHIHEGGHIEGTTKCLTVVEGKRPSSIAEAGGDPGAFAAIQWHLPGQYQTKGFMGGATALLVPFRALTWLPEPLMERLATKYDFSRWPDEVLIMLVRNTAAPAIQNSAEPAGGMAETTDLLLEQLKEIVEVGVYREDGTWAQRKYGWVRFVLPKELERYQTAFDIEQKNAWEIVRLAFQMTSGAELELLPLGQDTLDGRHGVIATGPVGDFSFLHIARLHLEGTGWRLLDTEARPGNREAGEPEWVALRRTVMVVVPRDGGKCPIGFHFGDDGGLHPCGIHVPLSYFAWEYNLTHLGREAIQALGWRGDWG